MQCPQRKLKCGCLKMAWKARDGCEELVLVQPHSWQALVLVAGHACGGAASKPKTSAASRAFLRAVPLCPAVVIASLSRLQTLHVKDRGCLLLKPSASGACLRGGCVGRRRVLGRESPSLCLSPGSSPSSLSLHWDIHKYVLYC